MKSNWKRISLAVLATIVVLAIGSVAFAGVALARGPRGGEDGVRDLIGIGGGPAYGFVDVDGDGINDRFVDVDGDGICDYCGGYGFVDVDGDGICDYCGGYYMGRGRWAAGR
ncbi:MAG: hypothetical protein H8E47_13970 [Anaerolineales bacterium]|nr:hypothetical protein [Anaerolineales bacterium]